MTFEVRRELVEDWSVKNFGQRISHEWTEFGLSSTNDMKRGLRRKEETYTLEVGSDGVSVKVTNAKTSVWERPEFILELGVERVKRERVSHESVNEDTV